MSMVEFWRLCLVLLWLKMHQDSFYKILTPEQHTLAHKNEYDLDAPEAIDFDLMLERLKDIKKGSGRPRTPWLYSWLKPL